MQVINKFMTRRKSVQKADSRLVWAKGNLPQAFRPKKRDWLCPITGLQPQLFRTVGFVFQKSSFNFLISIKKTQRDFARISLKHF
jgi:hypothetical protein